MKHNAKRILSMVLCVLMCVSMLTGIVLPAAATETPETTDPYAVITGEVDANGVITPDNAAFFNRAWATAAPAAEGEQFEYTYGDGDTWGNGKTYRLTWKENAFPDLGNTYMRDMWILPQSTKWATDETGQVSRDLVAVFAPGEFGAQGFAPAWSKAHKNIAENNFGKYGTNADVEATQDDLMNLYYLGPQAGKSAVNADKSTKENAKKVQNNRSVNSNTEAVFTGYLYLSSFTNMTIDGIAGSKYITFCADGRSTCRAGMYTNFVGKNIYIEGKIASNKINATGQVVGGASAPVHTDLFYFQDSKNLLLEFDDCYFDLGAQMHEDVTEDIPNTIIANKFVLDNCVFANAKVHKGVATHQTTLYPLATDRVTEFCGEYTESPLFEIKNSTVADWEGCTIFRFNFDDPLYEDYTNHSIKINFTDSKFYDISTTLKSHGMPLYFNGTATPARQTSFEANITGNLFSYSDEVFDKRTTVEIETITFGSTVVYPDAAELKFFVKDNIFKAPNHNNNANWDGVKDKNKFGISLINSNWHTDDHRNIDMSDNLFMDNQGNIQPLLTYDNVVLGETLMHGPNVNSDIYADEQMRAGVRELMAVTEVKNGVAAYCYIQMRAQARYRNFDYFTGALTLLLKDGRKYDADTLIKTSCNEVEYLGIYEDEACTKKVEVITNDTVNGKFAKLQYKTATTTLTVVYALNTPENILVVTHPNSHGNYNYSYEFNGETYTNGVNAEFFSNIGSAVAAAEEPYKGDLLDKTTAKMYPDETTNGLKDLIVVMPGEYSVGKLEISKSVAIVGPQWCVSPYGSYEDAPGNNRQAAYDEDDNGNITIFEAAIDGTIAPEGAYSFVLDGVAFAGDYKAFDFSKSHTTTNGALLQYNVVKNCIFANDVATVIDGEHSTDNAKVLNITFKDNTFINRTTIASAQNLINYRAKFSAIENIAIFGLDCQVVKENGGLPESETIVQNGFAEPKQSIQNIYYHVYHTDTNTETESGDKVVPTCVSYGSVDKLCNNCQSLGGFVEILAPDPTNHTNLATNVDAKDATCGADGYTGDTVCFDCCLVVTEGSPILATNNHNWQETENIPATPSENGLLTEECTVCHKVRETELPFTGVAKIGETIFSDLNEALDTAKSGETVTLIVADHTVDSITVKPGITLDLGGKTLRANYIIGFKDSAIVGKNSKIYIAKENVALDKQSTKDLLPVYYSNKGYYKFISSPSANIQEQVKQYITLGTIYYFLPNGLQSAKSALLSGSENSGVKVVVRLSWHKDIEVETGNGTETVRNYTATQDYVYSDATVNEVINSYQNGSYASLFTAKFAGTEADSETVSGLTVRAMLVSETGVEITSKGISFELNNPNTDDAGDEGETNDPAN